MWSSHTTIEQNHRLGNGEESDQVDRGLFQSFVGRLIYLSHTRSDVAYAFGVARQFMYDARKEHLHAVYRILWYLKASLEETYDDGSLYRCWLCRITDRQKINHWYCVYLGGNLVVWRNKKPSVMIRSSAEVEYRAMAYGCELLLWLRIVPKDLRLNETVLWSYIVITNYRSALPTIQFNMIAPNIEIDRNFIKEKLDDWSVATPYVPTKISW